MDAPSEAARLAAAFAAGGAEEREAAYRALEEAARGSGEREQAVALAAACVEPLGVSVLCAPSSRIAVTEWRRAMQLLYEMCTLDPIKICAKIFCKADKGTPISVRIWMAPDSVFAEMITREPSEWTPEDAITAALECGPWQIFCSVGDPVFAEGGSSFADLMSQVAGHSPHGFLNPEISDDKLVPLALLVLDLVRSETRDTQPEAVLVGARRAICMMSFGKPPVSRALWEAGFLDATAAALQRYNPMERVMRRNWLPVAIINALTDVAMQIGAEARQPLLDAGAVDIAISTLTAYQMLGNPEEASPIAVVWGGLQLLDQLDLGSPHAKPIVDKLRSAGVDCFRYCLDHPLVLFKEFGSETGVTATKIAALVWGRDDALAEGGGGLTFKQQDVNVVVQMAGHRGTFAEFWPMKPDHGLPILNLCVSDEQKDLLLASEGFVSLLVE
jgi:hypothetical protein